MKILRKGYKMSNRIESIDDLAKIAGAELGTAKGKSKIDQETPAKQPTVQTSSKSENPTYIEPTKKFKMPKKPTKKEELYNAFETGTITLYPYGTIVLSEVRNRPCEINDYTRSLKIKDLPKLIKDETLRAATLRKSYESGLDRGDNCIGYVLASLSVERDVKRMEAYLSESLKKEKA